jgi:GxxExxY protein
MNTTELAPAIAPSKSYSLQPVTRELIGAAFEVHRVLGFGFTGRVYQHAMQVELQLRGFKVELEPLIQVRFKGVAVGDYSPDLLLEDHIIVEFKTDAVYRVFHNPQLLNQLRGTGIRLGFIINFGHDKVDYKRMFF